VAVSRAVEGSGAGRVENPHSTRPSWLYPTVVVVVLSAFAVYAFLVGVLETRGSFGPYLSPFFSPPINVHLAGFLVPPGIWIGPFPLAFRLTCYYYRKAIFRGFLWHPRSCAVSEPRRGAYHGETRFWIFDNLHRFALYLILVQTAILWYDAVNAFVSNGSLHVGLGNLVMVVNVVCLAGYTLGCHSLRHLVGGGRDCFSCHRARYQLWRGVTVLNLRHETWAWLSMFTVWGTDLYIRLLIHGIIPSATWN
jgi:hypothetical protein